MANAARMNMALDIVDAGLRAMGPQPKASASGRDGRIGSGQDDRNGRRERRGRSRSRDRDRRARSRRRRSSSSRSCSYSPSPAEKPSVDSNFNWTGKFHKKDAKLGARTYLLSACAIPTLQEALHLFNAEKYPFSLASLSTATLRPFAIM